MVGRGRYSLVSRPFVREELDSLEGGESREVDLFQAPQLLLSVTAVTVRGIQPVLDDQPLQLRVLQFVEDDRIECLSMSSLVG